VDESFDNILVCPMENFEEELPSDNEVDKGVWPPPTPHDRLLAPVTAS